MYRVHPIFDLLISADINGASFISIDTETVVRLTGGKSNPHLNRVTKRTYGSNVMVFQNKRTNGYENMVHRRLEQEGKDPTSFQLSERQWGTRLPDCPFVTHKDELYLEVIFLRPPTHTELYLDTNRIEKKDVIGYPDREEGEQGGLDNNVIIRTYNVKNIRGMTVNKTRYNFLGRP